MEPAGRLTGLDAAWPAALEEVAADPRLVVPVFQPIVDVRRGAVCGYEALARFEAGRVSAPPSDWFAAAALYGYGPLLETTVLRSFLAARRRLPANCFLSLNVSPEALVSEEMRELHAEHPDLRGIVVEITEQTQVEDYGVLEATLGDWRAGGAQVAVDDAGSGYASLRHILTIGPQFVKLDRSLVDGLHLDARKVAVVSAIGAFASSIDAWLVAEGVELREELDVLADLEVPLVQGYLLGRPDFVMAPLEPGLGHHLRSREIRRSDGIAGLVEHAPTEGSQAGDAIATDAMAVATTRVAFRVDEHGRPTEVVIRDRAGEPGTVHPAMRAGLSTSPTDLAERAMARSRADRLAPIACCDEEGRLLGVVRIERLVEGLLRELRSLQQR